MGAFDFLVRTENNNSWSDTTLMLLLIMFSLGITLTIALAAPQDIQQLIPIALFSFMTLMTIVGLIAKNVIKPPLLNVQGINKPLWALVSGVVGFVAFGLIYLGLTLLNPDKVNAGNILPLGSIGVSVQQFKLIQLGLFAPFLETMFFVAFLYPTLLSIANRFEATKRIMFYPLIGPIIMALIINFAISFLFACHHTLVYSELNVGSANFYLLFIQNLMIINGLCITWIFMMQITKSVVAPIIMHLVQNWFSLIDATRVNGVATISIIDFFLWIVVPIFIAYSLAYAINKLLPRPRRTVIV